MGKLFDFLATFIVVIIFMSAMFFLLNFNVVFEEVELPHNSEKASLISLKRTASDGGEFISTNIDKWQREIDFNGWSNLSVGGGYSEKLLYYLDSEMEYKIRETGGVIKAKEYECIKGECNFPFIFKSTSDYLDYRVDRVCYNFGTYRVYSFNSLTGDESEEEGKGCPFIPIILRRNFSG